jgi:hypothetical protein
MRVGKFAAAPAMTVLGMLILGIGCGADRRPDQALEGNRSAGPSGQVVDSILADSAGVIAGIRRSPNGERFVIAIRDSGQIRVVYTSDTLPVTPGVQLGGVGDRFPAVLWTFETEEFVGGILTRLENGSPRIIYQRFHPIDGVCAKPRFQDIGGRIALVEERAAVFGVAACVDPAEDCVWQFTSTWPVPFAVSGDSVREATNQFPKLYEARAREFRTWARRIEAGALVEGQNLSQPETIKSYCGAAVVDSLISLADRADRLAQAR